MESNQLLALIERLDLSYRPRLLAFFQTINDNLEKLHNYANTRNCPESDQFEVRRLENWLTSEGISLYVNTISSLTEEDNELVLNFISYYNFLLQSAKSLDSKIDLLFLIPICMQNELSIFRKQNEVVYEA